MRIRIVAFWVVTSTVTLALVVIGVSWLFAPRPPKVHAQNNEWVTQELGNTSGGGMAQYGAAELNSTSSSSDLQALTNWNNYINARSGWSLSSTDLSRLANADYNARHAGAPTITAQQLTNAVVSIINATLSTMSESQQQSTFNQYFSTSTPNGQLILNIEDPNISATQNSNGTVSITAGSAEYTGRKSFFQTYAPTMVSASSNFYPGEAIMVTYSLATGDLGYDNAYISAESQAIANLTGASMSGKLLFGDNGYLVRRPMHTFLSEANISQFFSDLGF